MNTDRNEQIFMIALRPVAVSSCYGNQSRVRTFTLYTLHVCMNQAGINTANLCTVPRSHALHMRYLCME